MKYLPVGDSALSLEFGEDINYEINNKVRVFNKKIKSLNIDGIVETVPSFKALLIYYDPAKLFFSEVKDIITNLFKTICVEDNEIRKIIEIPVCYDEEFGEDLDFNNMCRR